MIFENLWPLLFLAAIPIIIILYLLKPKGTDYRISSNLLWKQLLHNQESKTFLEKFVHNILMYLQILIVLLLVVALMSPFIHREGKRGGRVVMLFDTSASMQHKTEKGVTRLEEAVATACDYVRASDNTRFSIVTHDDCGTRLLSVEAVDQSEVVRILKSLSCSDAGGNLSDAQSMLSTLTSEGEGSSLIVFTDGAGALDCRQLTGFSEIILRVSGEAASNVASNYLAVSKRGEAYDAILSVTNYSDSTVSLDASLYDGDSLLSVKQLTLEAGENISCLFEQIDLQGSSLQAVLSGFHFAGGGMDSLEADNVSYAVKEQNSLTDALLVGAGNTYIEKAYRAATGASITRAEEDSAALAGDFQLTIYDAGTAPSADYAGSRLLFAPQEGMTGEITNVLLEVRENSLTQGLSDFQIGVNKACCYDLPESAVSFLEYQGKCVGYYGEQNGYREVVLGFDIRESDFPLRAEFPVFITNVLTYLSDSSWLGSNVYYAGEKLVLKPWADPDNIDVSGYLEKAGLYSVGNENYEEYYVVRPATHTESDGRLTAESDAFSEQISSSRVRQTLRNLFLVLALVLLCVEWIIYVKQLRYRGKFYLGVRLVLTLCLLLALLGVQISLGSQKSATIFLADLSDSNQENIDEMTSYLQETISNMPKGHQYGIVTFGGNAMVEQFLTDETFYTGLMTTPDQSATNLEEALSRALAMMPSDAGGRLVFLTDGRQTKGDIRNMASALSTRNAELLAMVYESESRQDAYVENVTMPSYLHPGDIYSVTVQITSNYETDAQVKLLRGSSTVAVNDVHLNKGANRFVFKQQVTDESMESLRIQVEAPGDACAENNMYSVYSVVEAAPRVLVISGMDTDTSQFASLLHAAGCSYSVVSALNAPQSLSEMLEYKSILLVNTYISDLPDGFLNHIESYVRDYGGGFVCCGGEDSFALGGYRDSVLETVLPVDMELRGVDEIPSMAMVMVIDRSGSMTDTSLGGSSGASNLDLAIRSATVAVDNLRTDDYVGVLTFDTEYNWQVELTQPKDKRKIKEQIESIPAGGGTTIMPSLEEACNAISKCDVSVRHVVLLTDGMGETSDFEDIIDRYTDNGITLSTVAVGDGSDTRLLEHLADSCGGRYYYADANTDLPRIFAQEVFLGGDSFIQNGDIAVSVNESNELARGLFPEGWPHLGGYISSTPKTGSHSVIVSAEKEDPILTVWQYGLGHAVAWNTDVTNQWSSGYAGQEDYVQLWKRIVDYSAGAAGIGEDSVEVAPVGGHTSIVYTTEQYDEHTTVTAHYVDPAGNTGEIALSAIAPGHFEAELDTPRTGIYNLHIRKSDNGEVTSTLNTAAAVQFSDEYKFDIDNMAFLDFVEKYGKRITSEDDVWVRRKASAKEKYPLTNWLLAFGILLFMADVAMRRFHYVPRWNGKRNPVPKQSDAAGKETNVEIETTVLSQSSDTDKKATKKKNHRHPSKEKPAGSQILDTSQLLRKKDERNG